MFSYQPLIVQPRLFRCEWHSINKLSIKEQMWSHVIIFSTCRLSIVINDQWLDKTPFFHVFKLRWWWWWGWGGGGSGDLTFDLCIFHQLTVIDVSSFLQTLFDQLLHLLWRNRGGDVLHQHLKHQQQSCHLLLLNLGYHSNSRLAYWSLWKWLIPTVEK